MVIRKFYLNVYYDEMMEKRYNKFLAKTYGCHLMKSSKKILGQYII